MGASAAASKVLVRAAQVVTDMSKTNKMKTLQNI